MMQKINNNNLHLDGHRGFNCFRLNVKICTMFNFQSWRNQCVNLRSTMQFVKKKLYSISVVYVPLVKYLNLCILIKICDFTELYVAQNPYASCRVARFINNIWFFKKWMKSKRKSIFWRPFFISRICYFYNKEYNDTKINIFYMIMDVWYQIYNVESRTQFNQIERPR